MTKKNLLVFFLSIICSVKAIASEMTTRDTLLLAPYYKRGDIVRYSSFKKESRVYLTIGPSNKFDVAIFDMSTALKMYSFGTVIYRGDTIVLNTSRNPSRAAAFKGKLFVDMEPVRLLKKGDKLVVLNGFGPRDGDKNWLKR
jgi:hypothetical protein